MGGMVRWGGVSLCLGLGCGVVNPPPASAGTGGSGTGGICALPELCAVGGASASGGASAGGSASGGSPPLVIEEETEEDPDCLRHCSSDLESILDCEGTVIEDCALGQACLGAACQADACAAAAASQSSIGCEFWVIKPDVLSDARAYCFAAVVANTWSLPLQIDVSWQGEALGSSFIYLPRGQGAALTYEPYDPTVGLPAGDVAVLFFSDNLQEIESGACPKTPYVKGDVGVWGTGRSEGFHIRTTQPAAAYSMLPYGGGATAVTSATLLLPTSRWEREYIAINPFTKSTIVPDGYPALGIVANEDGTTVDILPKVAIVAGAEVDPAAAGEAVSYQLERGEYLQITQDEELTGSVIVADKPIGVWGSATCMNVPVDAFACDAAHQQIPPVVALGSEYVAVRHRSRDSALGAEEESPWRVVAAVDGTVLTWEPTAPPDAPPTLARGEVYEFWSAEPFVVRSQDEEHPFYVAQYMTSAWYVSESAMEGDPEWVNVVPAQQYLSDYVFFTDPTYPETSLVVVRAPDATGAFADVFLECEGALSGWQAVGPYECTRTRLVQGDFANVGSCSNGIQRMESALPFGVTVWGWGTAITAQLSTAVSYAYPAGVGLRSVNEVRLPPPVVK